jgi:hypothetical protein
MRRISLAAAMAAFCWAGSSAMPQTADIELGVLTCTLAEPADAPASDLPGRQGRDALCSFRPAKGAEETYIGRVQGVSLSPDQKGAVIWRVTGVGVPVKSMAAGVLEQAYAADAKVSSDQAPMIGEANPSIVLHSMADRAEGSASAARQPLPTGFVITSFELKLKSTVS